MNAEHQEKYNVNDKPGKGAYACETCGWHVTLHDDDDPLPSCKICSSDDEVLYLRIS